MCQLLIGTALNIGGDTALNIGGDAATTRLMDPERERGDDSVDATTRLMDPEDDSMDGPGRRLDEYDLEMLHAEDDSMDTTTRYWWTREQGDDWFRHGCSTTAAKPRGRDSINAAYSMPQAPMTTRWTRRLDIDGRGSAGRRLDRARDADRPALPRAARDR